VQRIVPAGTEFDEALRIANAIAQQAPLAVVATRLNAWKAVEQGPLVAMAEFDAVQQRLANSEDAKEGVASFVEKRAAVFEGR
jgi:enoyl-CoA hydratase/carnithine racemase